MSVYRGTACVHVHAHSHSSCHVCLCDLCVPAGVCLAHMCQVSTAQQDLDALRDHPVVDAEGDTYVVREA